MKKVLALLLITTTAALGAGYFYLLPAFNTAPSETPSEMPTLTSLNTLFGAKNSSSSKSGATQTTTTKRAEQTQTNDKPAPSTPAAKAPTDRTGAITANAVIAATNLERREAGIGALTKNALLSTSAEEKARDMLRGQYFSHTSPSGVTMKNVIEDKGYHYLVIGENIALGNFLSADAIITAWMKSPGHKANMLNSEYTDIGVGVIEGEFDRKMVWIAVQHFGKPR